MARKPKVETIDALAVDVTSNSTALVTGTVPTPEQPVTETTKPDAKPADDTPKAGDNSETEALPSLDQVRQNINDDVHDLFAAHSRVDHVVQRLAYHLGQRHAVLYAMNPASVPPLKMLAMDSTVFDTYWEQFLVEFVGPAIDKAKVENAQQGGVLLSRMAWNNRCKRSLVLISQLAYLGVDYADFDHDKLAFRMKPVHFCPNGYMPTGDLANITETDANGQPVQRIREHVWLGDDTGKETYFIAARGGRPYVINLSIRQVWLAVNSKITAAKTGTAAHETNSEPTSGRQQRKAAAAGETARSATERAKRDADEATRKATEAKAKADAAVASEKAAVDSQTPEDLGDAVVTGEGEAAQLALLSRLATVFVTADKLLAHDLINTIAWDKLPLGAQNGLIASVMWFDRLKAAVPEATLATMAKADA